MGNGTYAAIRAAQSGDSAAMEKLTKENIPLIRSIAGRFRGRGTEDEDLFQLGAIGFIKAVRGFDTKRGLALSTYAVPMIQGELRRYLRDYGSVRVSRSLKDIAYRAMKAKETLTVRLMRDPTINEIAKEMDEKRENVVMALESIVDPVSLYEPIYSDSGDAIYVMDQIGDNSDDSNWLDELSIKDAIEDLGEREKKILSLRFMAGKTQVEVAEEIGISQAQVSRLEKGALSNIKNRVSPS